MRTIIAGSRTLPGTLNQTDEWSHPEYDPADIEWMFECIDSVDGEGIITEVISGGAKGADWLGEKWAYERGLDPLLYLADWDKHGKSAGYKRNIEMAQNADMLIAFWDGKSKGTKHMIETALTYGLEIHVFQG